MYDMPIKPNIASRKIDGGTRVVFLYPDEERFLYAAQALRTRGYLNYGLSPIAGQLAYKAFYADIKEALTPEVYSRYAMLVRDFYASDLRARFDSLFDFDVSKVKALIKNPNAKMEAMRPRVEALVAKYRDTGSPLEFYGSLHQAEGVAMLIDSLSLPEGIKGAIEGDDMGMGKTRIAIIAAWEALQMGLLRGQILVVVPKRAKMTSWPNEFKKVFSTEAYKRFKLIDHDSFESRATFDILQWDHVIRMPKPFFDNLDRYGLLIGDEAHKLKHETSGRSKVVDFVLKDVPKFWPMTGTWITKRPKDGFNMLRLLNHPLGRDKFKFMSRYQGTPLGGGKYDWRKPRNTDELYRLISDVYIRREKSQTGLPEIIRVINKVKLTPKQYEERTKLWDQHCIDNAEKMADPKYPVKMIKTMKIRQGMSLAKVPHVCEWAEDLIETGEKVLIFTCFTETFDAFMKHFGKKAVGIDGRSTPKQGAEAEERFQTDDEVMVFVGNVDACGEAITLTAGRYVGHNDLAWLPTSQSQAEARANRGGSTDTCYSYYFLGEDTEDEKGFEDFLAGVAVVQTATNVRDARGEIKVGKWTGDTEGVDLTDVEKVKAEPFDFAEAEEKPAGPIIYEGNPYVMEKVLSAKKETAKYLTYLLKKLLLKRCLRTHEAEFALSLARQFEQRAFWTDKQIQAAQRLTDRYMGVL